MYIFLCKQDTNHMTTGDAPPPSFLILFLVSLLFLVLNILLEERRNFCSSYFKQLYQADPPVVEMDVRGVTIPIADPPINCDPISFLETQAAVNWLKWDKAPAICGIHTKLLKAGGIAVLLSLHAVLCSAWNTGIIPTDW